MLAGGIVAGCYNRNALRWVFVNLAADSTRQTHRTQIGGWTFGPELFVVKYCGPQCPTVAFLPSFPGGPGVRPVKRLLHDCVCSITRSYKGFSPD